MNKNSFSIIIPYCNRLELVDRAVKSILAQTYSNWELILVNDGGQSYEIDDSRVKLLNQDRKNRCFARNLGMKESKNDWICWLDSDDSYINTYLEILNQEINDNPDYKVFNFGAVIFTPKGSRAEQRFSSTRIREPFVFEDYAEFDSGHIGTGHFIFHREVYNEVGGLPEAINPYMHADLAKKEFPELKKFKGGFYMEGGKELGNPWGDDYYMFYKITRKFKSKTLPYYLYIQYAHL
jgi:glycosyltransferase involved in cell wall biosynthesis